MFERPRRRVDSIDGAYEVDPLRLSAGVRGRPRVTPDVEHWCQAPQSNSLEENSRLIFGPAPSTVSQSNVGSSLGFWCNERVALHFGLDLTAD